MDKATHIALQNYIENIEYHIQTARTIAQHMQEVVASTEGDSDLNRYISMYLIPGLNHWISGKQAGNTDFIKDLLSRRQNGQVAEVQESAKMGNGHEVLTDPKKN